MISQLFGYSSEYEFHGPLELILGYIDFYELESSIVCKDFYLASKYSYLGRKIDRFELYRIIGKLGKKDKSVDEYLVRLCKYKCITFDNDHYLFKTFVRKGLNKIITVLLENEKEILFDPNSSNLDNATLKWASENGHLNIVKLLMSDSRVDPSDDNNYAIRWASYNGHFAVVKLLMSDSRVNPSDYWNASIIYASENGYYDIVKLLMSDSRVDPSSCDNEAIRWAMQYGRRDIVKLLMSDSRVKKKMNKFQLFIWK